jgi:hypothetical protein
VDASRLNRLSQLLDDLLTDHACDRTTSLDRERPQLPSSGAGIISGHAAHRLGGLKSWSGKAETVGTRITIMPFSAL